MSGESWVGRKENDDVDGLQQASRDFDHRQQKSVAMGARVSTSDCPGRRRQRSLMRLAIKAPTCLPVKVLLDVWEPSLAGQIPRTTFNRDDAASTAHQRRKPFKPRSRWPLLLQPLFGAGTRYSADKRSAGRLLSRQDEHYHRHHQTETRWWYNVGEIDTTFQLPED